MPCTDTYVNDYIIFFEIWQVFLENIFGFFRFFLCVGKNVEFSWNSDEKTGDDKGVWDVIQFGHRLRSDLFRKRELDRE